MSRIEDSLRIYKENIEKQKIFDAEKKVLEQNKLRDEELRKQKDKEEKDRQSEEKSLKRKLKLIAYSESVKPSEQIFNYFKTQIISGDLNEPLLDTIKNTGKANDIILFADNGCLESLFKAVDFGGTGRYTDQLRYGLDLNTIFDEKFLMKSTKAKIEKLWYPFQIGNDESEFNRVKSCLMYCLEKFGPYKYIIENGPFKDYVLYGEIQGRFLSRRYVYGIRHKTFYEKLVNVFSVW